MQRGVAEAIGAFALVFIGAGSIAVVDGGLVGVALAHGLVIAVMVSAVGHISGGHFNPAVTLGFLVTKRMAPSLAGVYWAAQMLGGLLGAILLTLLLPNELTDPVALGLPLGVGGQRRWLRRRVGAGPRPALVRHALLGVRSVGGVRGQPASTEIFRTPFVSITKRPTIVELPIRNRWPSVFET